MWDLLLEYPGYSQPEAKAAQLTGAEATQPATTWLGTTIRHHCNVAQIYEPGLSKSPFPRELASKLSVPYAFHSKRQRDWLPFEQ